MLIIGSIYLIRYQVLILNNKGGVQYLIILFATCFLLPLLQFFLVTRFTPLWFPVSIICCFSWARFLVFYLLSNRSHRQLLFPRKFLYLLNSKMYTLIWGEEANVCLCICTVSYFEVNASIMLEFQVIKGMQILFDILCIFHVPSQG